jgi:23S rRNA G2445 N2-methylase RlmL
MASTWDKKSTFVSPMCGSGTLAIEAAWMAQGVTPGMNRDKFAFQEIKGYNPAYFNEQLLKLNAAVKTKLPFRILASDIDEAALKCAIENAKVAGVDDLIDFTCCDFKEIQLPAEKGAIVMNPPYGERLGEKPELVNLYTEIGTFFKRAPGWIGAVLSGDKELDKWIKLKPAQKTPCLNGRIECRVLRFELYEGSRRPPK